MCVGKITFTEAAVFRPDVFGDTGQKLCLRGKDFLLESGGFTGCLNCSKVDVRGEVLFAGVGEQIVGELMMPIGAQGSVRPLRSEKFPRHSDHNQTLAACRGATTWLLRAAKSPQRDRLRGETIG